MFSKRADRISGHGTLVMCVKLHRPSGGVHAMTKVESRSGKVALKELLDADEDYLRTLVAATVEATLEAEMSARWERRRASGRRGDWAIAPATTGARW